MPMLPPDYKRPSTSNYVKLASGNNVLRVLAPPIFGWVGWTEEGDKKKPVRRRTKEEFKPGDVILDAKNKLRYFWAMPVWDYAKKCVAVWEVTQGTIMDGIEVLDNNAKWGDCREYDLCIVREGEGLETSYQVMPEPKEGLVREAYEAWLAMKDKFDLAALYEGGDPFDPSALPF